jgi:hypothetical protein
MLLGPGSINRSRFAKEIRWFTIPNSSVFVPGSNSDKGTGAMDDTKIQQDGPLGSLKVCQVVAFNR